MKCRTFVNGLVFTVIGISFFLAQDVRAATCSVSSNTTINSTYVETNSCDAINLTGTPTITWSGTIDTGRAVAITISSGTTTFSGALTMTHSGSSVTVASGAAATHAQGDATGVKITAPDVTITGNLDASGKGCNGGESGSNGDGPSGGDGSGTCSVSTAGAGISSQSGGGGGGGGGNGGAGGNGGTGINALGVASSANTVQVTLPYALGSGGGSGYSSRGGNGGGKVYLTVSHNLTINGAIQANGNTGYLSGAWLGGGGGAGGSVSIVVGGTVSGSGSVVANGGNGAGNGGNGDGSGGGGGGGGRIYFQYASLSGFSTSSQITVSGGVKGGSGGSASNGGAGVLAVSDAGFSTCFVSGGETYIYHTDVDTGACSSITFSPTTSMGMSWMDTIDTNRSVAMVFSGSGSVVMRTALVMSHSGSSLTVGSGVTLTQTAYSTTGVNITVPSMTVVGSIDVSGKGCSGGGGSTDGSGPSGGSYTGACTTGYGGSGHNSGAGGGGGGGAAHGGAGGAGGVGANALGVAQTTTYGSSTAPIELGAGGGGGYSASGGSGGGVVRLVISGALSLSGTIVADGGSGAASASWLGGGGGAGGSVYITVSGGLSGSGTISAKGGAGGGHGANGDGSGGGGGGGGRIAIFGSFTSGFSNGSQAIVTGGAHGGSGGAATDGSSGSLYTFLTNQNPSTPSSLGPASLVNGSTTSTQQPVFTFALSDADLSDTVKYEIQIDDSSDFGSVVVDYVSALGAQGSASFTVGQSAGSGSYSTGSSGQHLSSGSYYWRVKAIDNSSTASSYATANSGAVAFVIDATSRTIQFQQIAETELESVTATSVKILLSSAHFETTTVAYSISGTATGGGVDYTLSAGTATITAGQTSTTIPLVIVDNAIAQPNHTIILTLSSPTGANTSLGANTTFTYTITDNDTAGVTLSKTTASETEGGATDSYTLALTSAPTSTVTIALTTSTYGVTLNTSSVSFTSSTWSTPQTITITATNDDVAEGTHTSNIVHALSVSTGYAYGYSSGISVADVVNTITDNDTAGVTVPLQRISVYEGSSVTYSVVLQSQPTSTVVLVGSVDDVRITISPETLTFQNADWNVPQVVTITGVDDGASEGFTRPIITYVITSTDVYAGLSRPRISVLRYDNEPHATGGGSGTANTAGASTSPPPTPLPTPTSPIVINIPLSPVHSASPIVENPSFGDPRGAVTPGNPFPSVNSVPGTATPLPVAPSAQIPDASPQATPAPKETLPGSSVSTPSPAPSSPAPSTATPPSADAGALALIPSIPQGSSIKLNYNLADLTPGKYSVERKITTLKGKNVITKQVKNVVIAPAVTQKTVTDTISIPKQIAPGSYVINITLRDERKRVVTESVERVVIVKQEPMVNMSEEALAQAIAFSGLPGGAIVRGRSFSFSYAYKNKTKGTMILDLQRDLIHAEDGVVLTSNGTVTLRAGSVWKKVASTTIPKQARTGSYSIRVTIVDTKSNTVVGRKSFSLMVK